MRRIFILLIISISMLMESEAQQDTTANTRLGDKAPVFTCKTLDGKTYDLSKLTGKVVMINFFATWCPGCNMELPELEKEIWKKYRDNPGFVLLVIGREHTEKELIDFAAGKNLSLPFAADPKRDIYKLYASKYIPRNIVIDRDGKIIYQNSGFTSKELSDIEKLIEGRLK
ncbi:MAG: TlpA disulfide reductase family protein [Bacteroidales bacterium]|jgi:peroxiredoxin